MEEKVFHTPEVSGELKKFVEARLHADGVDAVSAAIKKLQMEYSGTVSLPVYVVLDPKTGAKHGVLRGATSADKFAAFLRRASAD